MQSLRIFRGSPIKGVLLPIVGSGLRMMAMRAAPWLRCLELWQAQ